MKNHLLCLFFLLSFISFGQNKQKIDSLKSLLKPTEISPYQAQLNLDISKFYINLSRDTCKIYAKKAEKIALGIKNNTLLNKIYLQLGIINYKQQKDLSALNYFNKIDSLHNLSNTFSEAYFMTKIYRSEISKFKFTMQGVMQAKKYLLEALALADKQNDKRLINLIKYRLAEWHGFISQEASPKAHLDTAKSYIKAIIPYYKAKNDYGFLAKLYHTLASIGMETKNYKYAKSNYIKRLRYIKKMGNPERLGEAYFSLGSFYRKLKDSDKGLSYLDSASIIFNKTGFSSDGYKKDLYKEYAYLYEEKKDYKKAFNNIYKAFVLKDKIYEQENTKKAMELEKKYQTQKKEHQIALLKTEKELVKQQKKIQQNILFGGIGITSLAGLFLFFMYRNNKKTTLKLQELDQAKSKFFTNISHEFRTPLTLIKAPLEQRLYNKNLSKNERYDFELMQRNTDRILNLINQLLDLSKLESGNLKLKVSNGNLSALLKSIIASFKYLATKKNLRYSVSIAEVEHAWFDRDIIEKIVINLLSNAFKYTSDKGFITFKSIVKNNRLQLYIENSGSILSKDKIQKIFNRFYQLNQNAEGVGIGLSLVKELVKLSHGNIKVENTSNKTILFTVSIPVIKSAFAQNEIMVTKQTTPTQKIHKQDHVAIPKNKTAKAVELNDNKPIILIVEDNNDVRDFVKRAFSGVFKVLEAADGKIGIEKAIEFIPDIIISDIMMPNTSGLELCKQLKQDERTCHIPIILLTAKAGDEDNCKGLKIGADAYITKPFKIKLLKTQVDNLLTSREILKSRYSQEVILKPKDIAITNLDEIFLNRIQKVLDNKLIDSSFNIEAFSKAVSLSRMQLHRKLKALTGLSASEFIRSQRLKLAAELLKKSDINVSQVGYSVGFNDHAYFSKCFKEAYKCTPSVYAQKNK